MWHVRPLAGRAAFVFFLASIGLGFGAPGAVQAQQPLSPFTATPFVPDGEICEFIQFGGSCQDYLITDAAQGDNFGAIKVGAALTPGVFVTRDNFPTPGSLNAAGPTGHHDAPASVGTSRTPTGFNLGRVFASYHPWAYDNEPVYFLAIDCSAPADLDEVGQSQPVAFDVDGDGSRETQSEVKPNVVSEAPTSASSPDIYGIELDFNNDLFPDLTILIAERRGTTIPFGAVAIDPGGVIQMIPDPPGQTTTKVPVRRYMLVDDISGTLGNPDLPPDVIDPASLARYLLDANDDGVLDYRDIGVGSDIELVVRHVDKLAGNSDPACITFSFTADSFDDVLLGGGAEDRVDLTVQFPVPDMEVTKEGKCIDEPDEDYRRNVSALPGSVVQFRIMARNWGNRDLNLTVDGDTIACVAPATASLIPGSCVVEEGLSGPAALEFCQNFEAALSSPVGFPLPDVVMLPAADPCAVGPGGRFVFLYRVNIGPPEGNDAFCDPAVDCTDTVSVSATMVDPVDPILPPSPPSETNPDGNSEEEDCADAACCAGATNCVPLDGIGDVEDEFNFTIFDRGDQADTLREAESGDDNRVNVEIKCRGLTFTKEVRLLPSGPFRTGEERLDLPTNSSALPLRIEYRYTVENDGEVREVATVRDVDLCADVEDIIAAQGAASVRFVDCPLCTQAPTGEFIAPIQAGGAPLVTSCVMEFATGEALRAFTRADDARPDCRAVNPDGSSDVLCHRNCARATGQALNLAGICPDGTIAEESFATLCYPICDLSVRKEVRCIDNCDARSVTGAVETDLLLIAPGSCVEFLVHVTNESDDTPLCRLRFEDLLSDQVDCIELCGDPVFSVDGVVCAKVSPGFNVNGLLFDWFPRTDCAPRTALLPGETLTVAIPACVPPDVNPACAPANSVRVNGGADCSPGTTFGLTCADEETASLQIRTPSLTCLDKQWSVAWDQDGDCEPDGAFSPFSNVLDVRDKTFPIILRLQIAARNTGQVPLEIHPEDTALSDCVANTPGVAIVDPSSCELGVGKAVAAGAVEEWHCDIRVDTAQAMRALDACDNAGGASDGFYDNRASVFGTPVSADTNICVPDSQLIPGTDACAARVQVPEPCDLTAVKQVKCADDPDAAYDVSIDAVAGSTLRYRIQIGNAHTLTKLPRVCLTDTLACGEWFVEGSVAADLAGTDVTACVASAFSAAIQTGEQACYTFAACRPGAPWLAPGETLTIRFDALVPEEFETFDISPDCVNTVSAEGRSEVCVPTGLPDDSCDVEQADANIDVLIPSIECDKQVRADLGDDGTFDTDYTADLQLPCDVPFPFRLEYRFTITNTGETPLTNVEICDAGLRAQAQAAGLTVGPCVLADTTEGCGPVAALGVGESVEATCALVVASRGQWEAFAGLDQDADPYCHSNTAQAQADVDARNICDAGADTALSSEPCEARACLAPECHIAVTKTVRCLDDCASGNPIGDAVDALQAAGGACVEFEVNVTNTDAVLPICRLRISDVLSDQGDDIVFDGGTRFHVGITDCAVPAGFNVNGTPFEWAPADCGLAELSPGETLTFSFRALIPDSADAAVTPVNTVLVEGAPTCPAEGPNFCCQDQDQASIDILQPSLACEDARWAVAWDQDGDCEPDDSFGPPSETISLRNVVFPVKLRLLIDSRNTGNVPLEITAEDSGLVDCVVNTPGVRFLGPPAGDPPGCDLGLAKLVMPGASTQWSCDLLVESAGAMRALDACDSGGTADGQFANTPAVSGRLVAGGTDICVPADRVIDGSSLGAACGATIEGPEPCAFEVVKSVKCLDDPDSSYAPTTEALPGSTLRYRIQMINQSDATSLPRVCVRESLGCLSWLVAGSAHADINGTDVTACMEPTFSAALGSNAPECYTFAEREGTLCRPDTPWIAPGETLTIAFDVRVPEDVSAVGQAPDCLNVLTIDGFSEACPPTQTPDPACASAGDNASIDVLVPEVSCRKEARADFGDNGAFDTAFASALQLPCDTPFPLRLEYRFTAANDGESPLMDVQVCDLALLSDATEAGLTVGPCSLDQAEGGCGELVDLAPGESASATCALVIPDRSTWELFAGGDTDDDENCYTNAAQSRAEAGATAICNATAETDVASQGCEASVCLAPECQVSVTKSVRCLESCDDVNLDGPFAQTLPVTAGACVLFRVDVTNQSGQGESLCRIEISDSFTGPSGTVAPVGNPVFKVGARDCPVPAGFNVSGAAFTWNPASCGLSGLDAGETLSLYFKAQIAADAPPGATPTNFVSVRAAPTCGGTTPNYCCGGSADVALNVLAPALTCDRKEWSFSWDRNGDCAPDGPMSAFASSVDLRDAVFPVLLRMRLAARNTGDVPLNVSADDSGLLSCVANTNGVSLVPGSCELGVIRNVAPGGITTWLCDIQVDSADAMRALDACDGLEDGFYRNLASVTGLMKAGAGGICVNDTISVPGAAGCAAQIQVPPPCQFDLEKQVRCVEGCGQAVSSDSAESVQTAAGAFARFEIQITNTDEHVKLPGVCLRDSLGCLDWLCPASVTATLAGTDVSADFAAMTFDEARRCFHVSSRPAAPWIAPGETLTLSLDVQVPADFGVAGAARDCINHVTVEGFTDACGFESTASCEKLRDEASLDVRVPRVACRSDISADVGNDGVVDIGPTQSLSLNNPKFPMRLIYTYRAESTGELPLEQVRLCDESIVERAVTAGVAVGPCRLCDDSGCDAVADVCSEPLSLAVGQQAAVTCEMIFASRDQWEAFERLDSTPNCYRSSVTAGGQALPPCASPDFDGTVESDPCETIACVSIVNACPITKAKFDIWNQNEVRFSGTERCVISWDQSLLSQYTSGNIANHFLRMVLQTNKGKARIDGIAASPAVCGAGSEAAPLIGVAVKHVNFGRPGMDAAARTLVGIGEEVGTIFYDPPGGPIIALAGSAGPFERVPLIATQATSPQGITEKGSLLVYPSVEIKWNEQGEVIQDTFITINNDFDRNVRLQMYFVNGDQPVEAVLSNDDPPVQIERAHEGCNWVDVQIPLTANEPAYWSALTGQPKGVSPFGILDPGDPPGRPDREPGNRGGRVVRGYLLVWAINTEGNEIRWNHLSGGATTVNYQDGSVHEYAAWSVPALTGAGEGSQLRAPFGRLDLDGREYDFAPARLLMDFYASGSVLSSEPGLGVLVDTELTLWVVQKDLRNP